MNPTNYIDAWYQEMRLIKWTRLLRNDPYFRNLDDIKEELDAFFDPGDFNRVTAINPDNWLLHIFSNQQDGSIYVINETAELLRFFKTLPDQQSYHLKNKKGQVNYNSLQEKLYELYIRYLFQAAGMKSTAGKTYLSAGGHAKEIDLLLEMEDSTYNVEITKFYDVYKESLVGLGENVLRELAQMTVKKTLTHDEAFSGYFAFKLRKEALIKKHKQLIGQQVKKFLNGYRHVENNTLLLPAKITTDDFEFDMESAFNGHYDTKYDQYLAKFPGSIKFRIAGDIQTNKAHVQSDVVSRESPEDQNIRLQNKIKEKLKQHRDSPYPLVIIIAVEQVFSTHQKNRTIAIRRNEIDTTTVHRLIAGKAAVMLVFKEVDNKGITYQRMILSDKFFHAGLTAKLEALDLQVRYLPVKGRM